MRAFCYFCESIWHKTHCSRLPIEATPAGGHQLTTPQLCKFMHELFVDANDSMSESIAKYIHQLCFQHIKYDFLKGQEEGARAGGRVSAPT